MEVQLPTSSSLPLLDAPSPSVRVDPAAPRLLGVDELALASVPEDTEAGLFLDRGEPLPTAYPGRRLRAIVGDPGTVWVSWENLETRDLSGWEIVALDGGGETMGSFRAEAGATGGYLHLPASQMRRVVLRALRDDLPPAPVAVTTFPPPADPIATEGGSAPWVAITRDEVFGDLVSPHDVGPLPEPPATPSSVRGLPGSSSLQSSPSPRG